jgi:imidazole glycerol-phosphate synthase subunit HisH
VIALIDYGSGNIRSVHKALRHLDADVRLVTRPEELTDTHAAVLPGVGSFDDCIHALRRQELLDACRQFIQSGRPFLGICVGYQALFERSTEFNSSAAGLGIFTGPVVRFQPGPGLKIPQIGWNQVTITQPDCPLFRGIPDRTHFYFVHSYFPQPAQPSIIAAQTIHGQTFASAIAHQHVFATQFHPEKSQRAGLQLLRNFLALSHGSS